MYLNAQTWINENKYQEAYIYATKVIADGHYPLASDYREIFLADNNAAKELFGRWYRMVCVHRVLPERTSM